MVFDKDIAGSRNLALLAMARHAADIAGPRTVAVGRMSAIPRYRTLLQIWTLSAVRAFATPGGAPSAPTEPSGREQSLADELALANAGGAGEEAAAGVGRELGESVELDLEKAPADGA